jgi:hypothetical protein
MISLIFAIYGLGLVIPGFAFAYLGARRGWKIGGLVLGGTFGALAWCVVWTALIIVIGIVTGIVRT